MKFFKISAVCATVLCTATAGHAATVDFSGFSSGDILGTNTDLGGGIVADISAEGGRNDLDTAVIFSTVPIAPSTVVTGNDLDLTSPFAHSITGDPRGFGNALIVQENAGDPIIPDDAVGGTLTFAFDSLISLSEVFLLDTAIRTSVFLYLDGNLVDSRAVNDDNQSETSNGDTPNEFTVLDFGGQRGDEMVVNFSESGALGEFNATVVPIPASLPLLIGGFGLMALMRRRHKEA